MMMMIIIIIIIVKIIVMIIASLCKIETKRKEWWRADIRMI